MSINHSLNDLGRARLINTHQDDVLRLRWNYFESSLDGGRTAIFVPVIHDVVRTCTFDEWSDFFRPVAQDNDYLRSAAFEKYRYLVLNKSPASPLEKRLWSPHAGAESGGCKDGGDHSVRVTRI